MSSPVPSENMRNFRRPVSQRKKLSSCVISIDRAFGGNRGDLWRQGVDALDARFDLDVACHWRWMSNATALRRRYSDASRRQPSSRAKSTETRVCTAPSQSERHIEWPLIQGEEELPAIRVVVRMPEHHAARGIVVLCTCKRRLYGVRKDTVSA